jgi:hypothetical protein
MPHKFNIGRGFLGGQVRIPIPEGWEVIEEGTKMPGDRFVKGGRTALKFAPQPVWLPCTPLFFR